MSDQETQAAQEEGYDDLKSLEEESLEDAVLREVPKGLLTVQNPHSPVVRVRRRQLTAAFYQNRQFIRQLYAEQQQITEQLAQLGGPLGNYFTVRDQLRQWTPKERKRVLRRMGTHERTLASTQNQFLYVFGPLLLVAGGIFAFMTLVLALIVMVTA